MKLQLLFIPLMIMAMLFLPTGVHSQDVPAELKQRLVGKRTLKAIMREVERYYSREELREEKEKKGKPGKDEEEFESGLSFWYKWQRYMAPRLNAKGELVNIEAHLNKIYDAVKLQDSARFRTTGNTTSRWNFVGPYNMNYYGGQYRGLGRLDCIAFHPTDANTFWVGSPAGGVWKTTDGGANWTCISFNLPTMGVSSIAVSTTNPNIIYILTGDHNGGSFRGLFNRNSTGAGTFVWKTTDGGFNWARCPDLPGDPNYGNTILVHPTNANIVFVAHENGLSRSTNGGASWLAPNPITVEVSDVKLKPGSPSTVYAVTYSSLRYSTDDGQTFTTSSLSSTGNTRKLLAVTPANGNVLYVLSAGVPSSNGANVNGQFNGIYRSINSGVNFSLMANTPNIYSPDGTGGDGQDLSGYCYAFAANPANASNIIAAGTIIWGSTNGGTTLTNYTDYAENTSAFTRYVHPDIHGLAFNPLNGNLYTVNDGGIWRSTNGGIAWTDISNGIHVSTYYSLAGFPGNSSLLAGGNQDNGVKYRNPAAAYAGDFTHVTGGDGFDAAFDATNSNRWYASGNDNLYRYNQGVFEKNISPSGRAAAQGDYFPTIATDNATGNTIYALYGTGMRRSTNAGDTWTNISQSVVFGNKGACDVVVCPSNNNRVYATNGSSIWRGDNSGTNWSGNLAANPGFNTFATITALAVWPGNADVIYATIGSVLNPGIKVFYSTNAGATWQNISGTLPDVPVLSIAVDQNNNAYIGTDLGVFYQASSSVDWTPYYNGLPRIPISALVINQGVGMIRAATYGHGIWEAPMFSGCDVNASLNGVQASNVFYEVSNQINSTAVVGGGSGTNVIYRAGAEVVLSPGFEVYETNVFRGYIGPCQSGPVPQAKRAEQPWLSAYTLPATEKSLVPYGSISIGNYRNNNLSLQLHAADAGQFIIAITNRGVDSFLYSKEFTLTPTNLSVQLQLPVLPAGNYLAQLFYNGRLVHYQEFKKPKSSR